MAAAGVVPSLNEAEDRHASFSLGLGLATVEQFAFEGGEKTLPHRFVVGVADRSMDGRTPASLHRSPKAIEMYCDPWSE